MSDHHGGGPADSLASAMVAILVIILVFVGLYALLSVLGVDVISLLNSNQQL